MEDKVLTVNQAAKLLKTSPETIDLMASEGRLGAFKVGNRWRFSKNHVLDWIRSQAKAQQPYLGRIILEFLDEGVAIINQDLKVVNCNNAYLKRYNVRREQVIGTACYEVSQGRKKPCPEGLCPVRAAFKLQRPVKMVHKHSRSGGRTSYSDIVALPLKYGNEPAQEVLEVVRDNTEVYRLNERLNWTLNFIAHELQCALGNAVMNVSALLDKKILYRLDSKTRREMLVSTMSSLKFIHDMSRNHLVYSKASAGQLVYQPSLVDFPGQIFRPVLAGLKSALAQRRLRMVRKTRCRRKVYCDRDLLRIALNNLINNATKYASQGTRIVCECRDGPGVFEFSVENQGPPIPKDKAAEIFREFVRLNPSGNPGTGLGLFVVKKIAEMHHGKIMVHSSPGKGSPVRSGHADALVKFTLTIPQPAHKRT